MDTFQDTILTWTAVSAKCLFMAAALEIKTISRQSRIVRQSVSEKSFLLYYYLLSLSIF